MTEQEAAAEEVFQSWLAENWHAIDCGAAGNVIDLLERLNAAVDEFRGHAHE